MRQARSLPAMQALRISPRSAMTAFQSAANAVPIQKPSPAPQTMKMTKGTAHQSNLRTADLLLLSEASSGQQVATLGGFNLSACDCDYLGFAGLLRGGVVTPVEQPRNDASATDGNGHNGPQQREG